MLADILGLELRRRLGRLGETVVRFLPGGPEGRPSCTVSASRSRAVRRASDDGRPRDRAQLRAAGVSLATADAVVERLRAAVESTGATGFGAFAGLHPLDDGRLLAASTDGVGTKLVLARARGRLRDCGADLAAHCINDVLDAAAPTR